MKNIFYNSALLFVLTLVVFVAPTASADIEKCGDVVIDVKGNSAGLIYQPTPVKIAGVQVSTINTSENCAVISWTTNTPATSQIVFAEAGEDVSINATEENFGFPKATTQNNDALVQHKAIIKNLETGKTYTYRVVSRSHPSAVATVDEARTLVIFNSNLPLKITAVPVTTPILITVTSNTHTDINTHTDNHIGNNVNSTPSMTNKQTSVQDTDQTTIADVPAAITAITDIDTSTPLLSSSLFARLKQTFSFDFNLSNKLGFLLPTFVILFAVYLLQQAILPMLGITVDTL